MSLLIKNGRLIDPATGRDGQYDVLVKYGKVEKVAPAIDEAADTVIDAKGCYVVPGLIDLHVHLREPGFEYKETIKTGAMAAARGGFTSICPMPNTKPAIDSPEMVSWLLDKAQNESVVNIWPVGAVTKGQSGKEMADIAGMAAAGAVAISDIHCDSPAFTELKVMDRRTLNDIFAFFASYFIDYNLHHHSTCQSF